MVLRGTTVSFKFYLERKIAQARPVLVWMLTLTGESSTGDLLGNGFAWDEVEG